VFWEDGSEDLILRGSPGDRESGAVPGPAFWDPAQVGHP
jgi:hypothetical protein